MIRKSVMFLLNKNVTDDDKYVTTYYVRDPQGNVLAVYEHKRGELTNHLGNVMAVISDEASTTAEPTVVSLSDYYPFGMTELGRNGYESQLDSPDDQKSIKKGIFHAQSHKYRKIKNED